MSSALLRSVIAGLGCLVIIVFVNMSIADKERQLASGRIVFLELAPVDPRSLMQGDYMALNYKIANDLLHALRGHGDQRGAGTLLRTYDGRLVADLDERQVATFNRLEDASPLGEHQIYLRYRVRGGRVFFATDAFFFQEGQADLYSDARYGEFRVADNGDVLLTGLRNEKLEMLGPQAPASTTKDRPASTHRSTPG